MQRDYVTGFLTVAIGIFVLIYAQTFSRGGFSVAENAAVYPQLLSGVLIFLGGLLTFDTFKSRRRVQAPASNEESGVVPGGSGRVFLIAVSLILFVVITWLVGFIPANLIFCFAAPLILGTSKRNSVIVSVALSLLIYVLFFKFLQVPIPAGILFE